MAKDNPDYVIGTPLYSPKFVVLADILQKKVNSFLMKIFIQINILIKYLIKHICLNNIVNFEFIETS